MVVVFIALLYFRQVLLRYLDGASNNDLVVGLVVRQLELLRELAGSPQVWRHLLIWSLLGSRIVLLDLV